MCPVRWTSSELNLKSESWGDRLWFGEIESHHGEVLKTLEFGETPRWFGEVDTSVLGQSQGATLFQTFLIILMICLLVNHLLAKPSHKHIKSRHFSDSFRGKACLNWVFSIKKPHNPFYCQHLNSMYFTNWAIRLGVQTSDKISEF